MKYIFYISLSLCPSLSLSLTGEEGVRTLFTGQREREKKRERERKRGRARDRERERKKERELYVRASRKCG
jgi:hypothetical protein